MDQLKAFISRTREFAEFPREGSTFVEAAIRAVRAVGCSWHEMGDFPADSRSAEQLCRDKVRVCNIWVGIIGFRYGTICPSVGLSYTELEFEEASGNLERLAFLWGEIDTNLVPHQSAFESAESYSRQETFRRRIEDELVCSYFHNPYELQNQIESSLRAIAGDLQASSRPDWIEALDVEETEDLLPRPIDLAFQSEVGLAGVPEACFRTVKLVGHLERRALQPHGIDQWPASDQIAVARRASLSMEPMARQLSAIVVEVETAIADHDSVIAQALIEGVDQVFRLVEEIDGQLRIGATRLTKLLDDLNGRRSREWLPIAAHLKDIADSLVALLDVSSAWQAGMRGR